MHDFDTDCFEGLDLLHTEMVSTVHIPSLSHNVFFLYPLLIIRLWWQEDSEWHLSILPLSSDIKEGTNNWAWESPNWPIRARAGYSYECSVQMAAS